MPCYSGRVWDGSRFYEGHVFIEDGRVTEVGDGTPTDSIRVGCIIPGLTDGQTHVGKSAMVKMPAGITVLIPTAHFSACGTGCDLLDMSSLFIIRHS